MLDINELVGKNVVVVGEPKTGKTHIINSIINKLTEDSSNESVLLITGKADKTLSKVEKNVVRVISHGENDGDIYNFIYDILVSRAIAKMFNSDIFKKHLTIIIDDCLYEIRGVKVRGLLKKVNALDNINYIVTAFSADNKFPDVDKTVIAHMESNETGGFVYSPYIKED